MLHRAPRLHSLAQGKLLLADGLIALDRKQVSAPLSFSDSMSNAVPSKELLEASESTDVSL